MVVKTANVTPSASSGTSKVVFQYSLIGKFVDFFPSLDACSLRTGLDKRQIGLCANGKITSYKGFIWKYAKK